MSQEKIAIIGLGYVGLPLALGIARHFPDTIGYDIQPQKVDSLRRGVDPAGEIEGEALRGSPIRYSCDAKELENRTFFIVAVPTPVDRAKQPDLEPLRKSSECVGRVLKPGAVVVYESTVYPGVTEEFCGPILARVSGLRQGVDFHLGYSPERINPGDREHTLERIVKIVSGDDAATLERVAGVYGRVVTAGIHKASSIKVAEAAKVIENTQRDLNIALMNELAIIFDRLNIRTAEVLKAAGTKWNFLPFKPGLVGGHCIGVDPYYLTAKAEELGYHPQVILAGRRINDGMGAFIAQRLVKLLGRQGGRIRGARVGILGLTFKENVRDLRNSRIPDILHELREFGMECLVHEPNGNPEEAHEEYGIALSPRDALKDLDALILAVPHTEYIHQPMPELLAGLKAGGVFVDVKAVFDPAKIPAAYTYWQL